MQNTSLVDLKARKPVSAPVLVYFALKARQRPDVRPRPLTSAHNIVVDVYKRLPDLVLFFIRTAARPCLVAAHSLSGTLAALLPLKGPSNSSRQTSIAGRGFLSLNGSVVEINVSDPTIPLSKRIRRGV